MKPQFPILEEVEKNDYANYRHLMFTLPIVLDAHCIVETGLGNGHSTRIFLEALSQFDDERELHTFELNPNEAVKKNIDNIRLNYPHVKTLAYWYLHVGKSVEGARKMYEYSRIDFLYLDSDHSYENVLAELDAFIPYLSEKAWIMLDDITQMGDAKHHYYFTRHPGENPSDVYYAAMDWVNRENLAHKVKWKYLAFTECRGNVTDGINGSGKLLLYRSK